MARNGRANGHEGERDWGPQISKTKLRKLMASCRTTAGDVAELNSDLGNAIRDATQNDHLNKKAFGVIRQMDKMDPQRLGEFWHALNLYYEESGLKQRADDAPRLAIDDSEESRSSGEVRQFPAPSSVPA